MSKLSFLKDINVIADEKAAKGRTGSRKEWNPPSGLTIRLWKDGSVYPSEELVKQFDLEYRNEEPEETPKENRGFQGRGFDVTDTQDYPAFQTQERLVIISAVDKAVSTGKVDLFGSVGYNADGTPKSTVMNQGVGTFGKTFLLPTLKEVYGVKLSDEMPYVDLVLLGQEGPDSKPFVLPEGKKIAFLPKRISRGDKLGQMTVARREDPMFYVLYPKHILDAPEQEEQVKAKPADTDLKTDKKPSNGATQPVTA